jgi:hypothetical protein
MEPRLSLWLVELFGCPAQEIIVFDEWVSRRNKCIIIGVRSETQRFIVKQYFENVKWNVQGEYEILNFIWNNLGRNSRFVIPMPISYDATHRIIVREYIPGETLHSFISHSENIQDLNKLVNLIRKVIVSLYEFETILHLVLKKRKIGENVNSIEKRPSWRLQRLRQRYKEPVYDSELVPVHGDPHLWNILLTETGRTAIIHCPDRFWLSTPEEDLAVFLADLLWLLMREKFLYGLYLYRWVAKAACATFKQCYLADGLILSRETFHRFRMDALRLQREWRVRDGLPWLRRLAWCIFIQVATLLKDF